jgi:hypothetical protein
MKTGETLFWSLLKVFNAIANFKNSLQYSLKTYEKFPLILWIAFTAI